MAKLKTTYLEVEAIDNLPDVDELPLDQAQKQSLPVARPGKQWVNAAIRRGQHDEYDNMMQDRYGEGW